MPVGNVDEPSLWPELEQVWHAFHLLLGQTAGEFGRAICGQDVAAHLDFEGVSSPFRRRLFYLGVLGMQDELKAWRKEQQEDEGADTSRSG